MKNRKVRVFFFFLEERENANKYWKRLGQMLPFTLVCVEWLPLFLLSCEEEGIQRFNPARKMKGVGGNGRGRRRRRAWIQSVSKVINLHSNPISLLPWRSHIICSTSKESNYRIAPSLTCSLILSFCSLPSMCDLLAVGDIPARKKKEGRKKERNKKKKRGIEYCS